MSPIPAQPNLRSLVARLRALEARDSATPPAVQIARSLLAPDEVERLRSIEERLAGDTTIEALKTDDLRFLVRLPRTTKGSA